MLSELAIKNFAIIDDVRIRFEKGLSVLTGETGAGKSMIISAVNLLLGSRASADMVRSGCESAELEACFEINEGSNTWRILEEQGMEPEEDLIIRRVISAGGKGKIFINSRLSTLELLKKITKNLAGISSQHAHQGLLKTENHLETLDAFAGTTEDRKVLGSFYSQLVPLKTEQDVLIAQLEKQSREQELIAFQVEEIENAAIEPGEDEALENRRHILTNAARIFEAVNAAIHETHDREGSVIERISNLSHQLIGSGSGHEQIEQVAERFSSVIFDLQDIVDELRHVSDGIDLDPASLDSVETRLDLISKLKRKYGPTLDHVFEALEEMRGKLDQTDLVQKKIRLNEEKIQDLEKRLAKAALSLSEKRKQSAQKLSLAAAEQLSALEMDRARFDIEFETVAAESENDIRTPDGIRIHSSGIDKIQFLLSPNPGEDLKPLAKIASGGELSRIVLALKAVLSRNQSLETLVFDEVDAGIGGATSEKVGLKLRQLSAGHQVICITHLAQIAKYGDTHYRIFKEVENKRTCTRIVQIEDDGARIEEIARMIGGTKISGATLSHARDMLKYPEEKVK